MYLANKITSTSSLPTVAGVQRWQFGKPDQYYQYAELYLLNNCCSRTLPHFLIEHMGVTLVHCSSTVNIGLKHY